VIRSGLRWLLIAGVSGWLAASVAGVGSALVAGPAATARAGTVRLGFFANLTHATALVGVAKRYYEQALGSDAGLSTQVYSAGPAEMTALLGGQLDAAYVGPSSALNAFLASHGRQLRIVAGATTGGAELVVRPSIASAADLRGRTLATPQKGNTQDVALRYWLREQGLRADADGTGEVSVVPQDAATTLDQFKAGRLDGAWLPEPWASRLVLEAGARVLVDERSLWPGGRFATTNLVVSATFLSAHPEEVRALIDGQLAADAWIRAHPADAARTIGDEIGRLTGQSLTPAETARAFAELAVTDDPLADTMPSTVDHAVAVGLSKKVDVTGLYDLSILNAELKARGLPPVPSPGAAS